MAVFPEEVGPSKVNVESFTLESQYFSFDSNELNGILLNLNQVLW